MRRTTVVLPAEGADKIRNSGSVWGHLHMGRISTDDMYVVNAVRSGRGGPLLPVRPPKGQDHLRLTPADIADAYWHRTTADTHIAHYDLSRRTDTCLPTDTFNRLVPTLARPTGNLAHLVITHVPDPPHPALAEFAAWHVTSQEAAPYDLAVEPDVYGLEQLTNHWPLAALQRASVLIIGVGSIGGAAATHLAAYGVGALHLLDPDRLWWNNVVRHVLPEGQIGRYKTEALADTLRQRWGITVTPHVRDAVTEADHVRALLPDVDVVVCAADGVAPRRITSHLARRAGLVAVLTSVLEDGAFGEVLRLTPAPDYGCLLCRRAPMYDAGQMDPERVQERGYGDGDPHRPMTAVGPDLMLMGNLAAKVTVASLLQRAGHNNQRLPGEQAIVALRPQPGFAAPFDLTRATDVSWHPATPPRPGCVTCDPA